MSQKQSTKKRGKWELILHNDNHNTFEHVIECLMEICGHNYLQSVQCATVVHNIGRCSIFVDSYDECSAAFEELSECGLKLTITKHKSHV